MEKFETPYVTITDAIASHAKWRPDKTALVCGDQQLTWSEFNRALDRVANGLIKVGLRKGDKVSVLMLNSIEMLEMMMGTVKEGIINSYVLAFFDKYLKGKEATLLKGLPSNYPEVEFNSYGRQAKKEK